jgi:hypothetical protein
VPCPGWACLGGPRTSATYLGGFMSRRSLSAHVRVLDTGRDGCAAQAAGAKLGATVHRHQATVSPFKRSIYLSDLTSGNSERHRATGRISFASRGLRIR